MKKEIIEIEKKELKNLLLWAMVGYCNNNGGFGASALPKVIAKYVDTIGMGRGSFPRLKGKDGKVTGETKESLIIAFEKQMPRRKFRDL